MFASPRPFPHETEIATIPAALRDVAGSSQLQFVNKGTLYDKREGETDIGEASDRP